MKTKNLIWLGAISLFFFTACEKSPGIKETTGYEYGVFVVNEGAFMANNGSISFFNPNNGKIVNNIFELANGRPAGDIVQSFGIAADTLGYIVVNASGKVEVVDLRTFKTIADPIIASYPRYFLQVTSQKGYLSNGSMDGSLFVIDLHSNTTIDTIPVGFGPEVITLHDNKVYVANSGGWGLDSTLSVVDINSDNVISTFQVGKVPLDLAWDADSNLWVYCKGYAVYNWESPYNLISETDAVIQKIDPLTGEILWQGIVGKAGDYTSTPPKFTSSAEGEFIYYLRPDGVYKLSVENPTVPASALINGSYYGIEVNPDDDHIYLFESSFTGSGIMKIYDANGDYISDYQVGIAPNGAVFHLK